MAVGALTNRLLGRGKQPWLKKKIPLQRRYVAVTAETLGNRRLTLPFRRTTGRDDPSQTGLGVTGRQHVARVTQNRRTAGREAPGFSGALLHRKARKQAEGCEGRRDTEVRLALELPAGGHPSSPSPRAALATGTAGNRRDREADTFRGQCGQSPHCRRPAFLPDLATIEGASPSPAGTGGRLRVCVF